MEKQELKISFQSKDEYLCPVCESTFHREELLSGSGRLIAGELTDELHRLYEPSAKYGEVYPLVYLPTVCPECWFASTDKDFAAMPKNIQKQIADDREERIADASILFPSLDFHHSRGLAEGAAAFYLVTRCYDFYPKEFSPTIKQGISSLRAGWLFDALDTKFPDQHYDWLARLFKRKANYFYSEAINREAAGKESLSGIKNFGPDADKNYAYEGALYEMALMKLKYGPQDENRSASLEEAKRTIAKIFGLGKSSKNKPGPLLEHARNLYSSINQELNEVDPP
jgi:uncharacterized protein (DUF2225 family)